MSLPLGKSRNINNSDQGYRTSETVDPLTEPDEYGTELHREARVWKVYVKETDQYDGDLVKGWNDSADVILALPVTPLVMLLTCSFVCVGGHSFMKDRTGHPFDQTRRRQQKWDMIVRWKMPELLTFLPSLIHVALLLFAFGLCITLWDTHIVVALPVICVSGVAFVFYITSSVAATFLESFPYATIISRICRTEIVQLLSRLLFEVPFFLGLIFSLIAALAFFIICLPTTLLTELNSVLENTRGRILAHDIRSRLQLMPLILPLFFLTRMAYNFDHWVEVTLWGVISEDVPRRFANRIPTIVKGFKLAVTKRNPKITSEDDEDNNTHGRDTVTSRALSWLIRFCEVPQSVDIALQSIAGATNRISRQPLVDCQATLGILQRIASSNLYGRTDANADVIVSLYSRALSFLSASANSDSDTQRRVGSELEISIWDLQVETEKKLAALIIVGNFEPTQNNLDALRIGSTVASNSLKILRQELRSAHIAQIFDSIVGLLKPHLTGVRVLHNTALLSLSHAATLILLFAPKSTGFAPRELSSLAAPLVTPENPTELSSGAVDSHTQEEDLLANSVEAQTSLSLFIELADPSRSSGLVASLATTCLLLYNMRIDQTRPDSLAWSEEVIQGLIARFSQREGTLESLYDVEPPGISTSEQSYCSEIYISRLDRNFMSRNRIDYSSVIPLTWTQFGRQSRPVLQEDAALSQLHALCEIYHLTLVTALSPSIYLFIVEVMCHTPPSSPLFVCGAQMLSKYAFPTLSEDFATVLEQRDLVPLLESACASNNQTKRYFAKGQLWLLASLYIYADVTASGREILKVQLDKFRRNGGESEKDWHWDLGFPLYGEVELGSRIARELGVWVFRLEECLRQSRDSAIWAYILDALRDVPPELRGLPSFTAWQRQAGDSPPNQPQRIEELPTDVREGTGTTHLTKQDESATGGDYGSRTFVLVADTRGVEEEKEGDAERVGSSQDIEATSQGPTGEAEEGIAAATEQIAISQAQSNENNGLQSVGDELRVTDIEHTAKITDAPQLEGEGAEIGSSGQGGNNVGDVVISMDRLDNQSS